MAQQESWLELEEYLKQYYIRRFGSIECLHTQLLLYCRRGWLLWLLRAGLRSEAIHFYLGYIDPLRRVDSAFANTGQIRLQIDTIWRSMTHDESLTELLQSHPPNVADLINDYMRLHFPEAIGHANPPGTSSPMWLFAVPLGQESNMQKLRCVFCQTVMLSSSVGKDMKTHLNKCPKLTSKWRPKVHAVTLQLPFKKRPRETSQQADHSQIDLVLNIEMLIRQVAYEALHALTRLGCNQQSKLYASELSDYLVSLANGTCPLEVLVVTNLIRDLTTAHTGEPQSSAVLQDLVQCSYKLEYLAPLMRAPPPSYEAAQTVQNEDAMVRDPHQQVAAQQQHLQVQNGGTLVSAPSDEEIQRAIEHDPASSDARLAELCLELSIFLETPGAGPSDRQDDPPPSADDEHH